MAKRRSSHNIPQPQPQSPLGELGHILELPPGAVGKGANISLSSNREAVVDGCRGILEFSDTVIRINTGNMVVRIIGRGLDIRSLTTDQTIIAGFIISVDFGS